jgi:hypothetical protein
MIIGRTAKTVVTSATSKRILNLFHQKSFCKNAKNWIKKNNPWIKAVCFDYPPIFLWTFVMSIQ